MHEQEDDMQLLVYPSAFGLTSYSPFCVKAIYLLNLSGFEWAREDLSDPRKMPHAKLPVLREKGTLISGSDAIQRHLESQGAVFFEGLTSSDRADARALMRMVEEHLYFLVLLDRWSNDEVWPFLREAYFGNFPVVVRNLLATLVRRNILRGAHAQGLGRLTQQEQLIRAQEDLDVIRSKLGQDGFLFGAAPTAADASVGAMLTAIAASPTETDLSAAVNGDEVLVQYAKRVAEACS